MENYDNKNTPALDFKGMTLETKCIKVYDGDTITVAIELGTFGIYKFACRLLHIDTPEIRGKTQHEKDLAQQAKQYVSDLLLNKMILLRFHGKDKYGRLLCEVESHPTLVDDLIRLGLARSYDGGARSEW